MTTKYTYNNKTTTYLNGIRNWFPNKSLPETLTNEIAKNLGITIEIIDDPELTLEQLKINKKYEISLMRYQNEISGITIDNTYTIKTDRESQSLITGVALSAIQDSTYTCKWKTENNTFIELNATQILSIANAVRNHVQNCFNKEAELINEINNCTTKEEINNIIWSTEEK